MTEITKTMFLSCISLRANIKTNWEFFSISSFQLLNEQGKVWRFFKNKISPCFQISLLKKGLSDQPETFQKYSSLPKDHT